MSETSVSYRELTLNGLWKNNPAIVQLLGLCPLLAVTGTVVNAIGLGAATILVLVCSNTSVSLLRCGVRTGYIVYRDDGEDCPELLETPDGLFESAAAWNEAFPCPE